MRESRTILENRSSDEGETVDSGCCGMAGSFGYEADHYEVSMQIGEQRLFPAVRETDTDTHLAAPGTSCRHQIADGTEREALHPAQLSGEGPGRRVTSGRR